MYTAVRNFPIRNALITVKYVSICFRNVDVLLCHTCIVYTILGILFQVQDLCRIYGSAHLPYFQQTLLWTNYCMKLLKQQYILFVLFLSWNMILGEVIPCKNFMTAHAYLMLIRQMKSKIKPFREYLLNSNVVPINNACFYFQS